MSRLLVIGGVAAGMSAASQAKRRRSESEVVAIDAKRRVLRIRDRATASEREEPGDRLVVATGASALRPPIPGIELPGVFLLRDLEDATEARR